MFSLIGEHRITVEDIKTMHRLFYISIDEANAGTWRKENIIVSGTDYAFPKPQEIEGQMQELRLLHIPLPELS